MIQSNAHLTLPKHHACTIGIGRQKKLIYQCVWG